MTPGARHARRECVTAQIGGERFTVFSTGWSKSRLNFRSLLRRPADYVINDAAIGYMRTRQIDPALIEKPDAGPQKAFPSQAVWLDHLASCSIDILDKTLLRALSEAAIWSAIRHHGLMGKTVVVSDGAEQFRAASNGRHIQMVIPWTQQSSRPREHSAYSIPKAFLTAARFFGESSRMLRPVQSVCVICCEVRLQSMHSRSHSSSS